MAYEKQSFVDGNTLYAAQLNHIEDGITTLESNAQSANLLDNWYLIDPINQKGLTEYNTYKYTIDRWYSGYANTIVTIGTEGVEWRNGRDSGSTNFRQLLGQWIPAGTYTLSAQVYTMAMDESAPYLYIGDSDMTSLAGVNITGSGLFQTTVTVSGGQIAMVVCTLPQGASVTISKIKLERSSVSTLASDSVPNRAIEVLKCQRHQISIVSSEGSYLCGYGIASTTTNISTFLPLPTSLRVYPTVTFSNVTAKSWASGSTLGVTAITVNGRSNNGVWLSLTVEGAVAGETYQIKVENGSLFLDANL